MKYEPGTRIRHKESDTIITILSKRRGTYTTTTEVADCPYWSEDYLNEYFEIIDPNKYFKTGDQITTQYDLKKLASKRKGITCSININGTIKTKYNIHIKYTEKTKTFKIHNQINNKHQILKDYNLTNKTYTIIGLMLEAGWLTLTK